MSVINHINPKYGRMELVTGRKWLEASPPRFYPDLSPTSLDSLAPFGPYTLVYEFIVLLYIVRRSRSDGQVCLHGVTFGEPAPPARSPYLIFLPHHYPFGVLVYLFMSV